MGEVKITIKPTLHRQLRISASAFNRKPYHQHEEDLWLWIESFPADSAPVFGAGTNVRMEAWIKLHMNNPEMAAKICRAINEAQK